MQNVICGATKKRTDEKCKNKHMENGKCRFHGGLSTGPKDREKKSEQIKGDKNAITTGEYESISYDTLLDDEKELYERVSTDPSKQVNGRYKILEIRTFRLMKRYADEMKKEKPDEKLLEKLEKYMCKRLGIGEHY